MQPPLYYRLAIIMGKPIYRMLLSFNSERREALKTVTQSEEFAMRFARTFPQKPNTLNNGIWIHAQSDTDVTTITPLINKLLDIGYTIIITNTTLAGFASAKILFTDTVQHCFLPIDSPKEITRFLAYYQPKLALFTETVLWPALLHTLQKAHIPSVLINAHMPQSGYRHQRFPKINQSIMTNISHIICQNTESIQRFQKLGADTSKLSIAPALQYAIHHTSTVTEQIAYLQHIWGTNDKRIIVASNTHDGEEIMLLAVYTALLKLYKDLVLVIIPNDLKRCASIQNMVIQSGYIPYCHSADDDINGDTNIYIGDTVTDMAVWYGIADIMVVAGSFIPHAQALNPLPALLFGKPVFMGTYNHLQHEHLIADLLNQQAMQTVDDHQALYDRVCDVLENPSLIQEKTVQNLREKNSNVLAQYHDLLQPYLPELSEPKSAL